MRTTLNLDAAVLDELRARARREGKPLGQVASEYLARAMAASPAEPTGRTFSWKSADLGEPFVDLEDKEAVQAVLDADR